MIKLILVTVEHELNADVREMYESAFPPDERRDWVQLSELITNPAFGINLIFDEQILIGLISVWNLNEFIFIEHFTIRHQERGKGYGTEVIRQIISTGIPVVLEVEEPHSEIAIQRIRFYERLQFLTSNGDYFQPPYSNNKKNIKMLLMSYPDEILLANFESTKKLIHELVYKFQE
jgi:hypothetical protein